MMNDLNDDELTAIITALECFMDVYNNDELYGVYVPELITKLEGYYGL